MRLARNLAIVDFGGRIEAVFANVDAAPTLLRNVRAGAIRNRISVKFVDDASKTTPKVAVGSVVYATTGKKRRHFALASGTGYAFVERISRSRRTRRRRRESNQSSSRLGTQTNRIFYSR